MSFIVTGLAWRWLLDPTSGLEKLVRDLGFADFTFDSAGCPHTPVIYTLGFAAAWHAAGLGGPWPSCWRGCAAWTPEIWKAARGWTEVPAAMAGLRLRQPIVPMLGGSFATATVLLATSVVRLYDLSNCDHQWGAGHRVRGAKFVMDHLFERNNIGLATAAAHAPSTRLATRSRGGRGAVPLPGATRRASGAHA